MAYIKLVIKIPEEIRLALINNIQLFPDQQSICDSCIKQAIINGTSLPPVTPKQKIGEWQRMSDLSEDEDDRYQCSRCGNVVHFSRKENLYTFSRWCGRCGSNNDRFLFVEQEAQNET